MFLQEPFLTLEIIYTTLYGVVLCTIQFDTQVQLRTIEIENIGSYPKLTPPAHALYLSALKTEPQHRLC